MVATSYDKAKTLLDSLKQHVNATPFDAAKCQEILTQCKVVLFGEMSLYSGANLQGSAPSREQLLARETLEVACVHSIQNRDLAGFERHVAQLKMYYGDNYGSNKKDASTQQFTIVGLYLLHLLASDRIGEFHTELELIAFDDHDNKDIKLPIQLERALMEGNYVKVLEAQKSATKLCAFFMERLVETVRMKVGASLERSYNKLPAKEATQMLNLQSVAALSEFAVKENERKAREEEDDPMGDSTPSLTRRTPVGLIKWEVKDGELRFIRSAEKELQIPALEIMGNTIGYATDLERIV